MNRKGNEKIKSAQAIVGFREQNRHWRIWFDVATANQLLKNPKDSHLVLMGSELDDIFQNQTKL